MSSVPPLLQSELSFRNGGADCLREWLHERRKTRLQRLRDWLEVTILLPFLNCLLALIKAVEPLKVIPGPVWTIGSMLISIAVYSSKLGWKLSAGFITLLLIHECGHLLAARWYGARMSVPIFIPFVGAIIDMKEPMGNAWQEAVFGISGPILGTLGACLCWIIAAVTHSLYFTELAFCGLFFNTFNLLPVGFLDGGHIAVVLSRWLWLPGWCMLAVFVWFIHSPAAILMLLVTLPMVFSLFKKKTQKQCNYDQVSIGKRLIMGLLYFSLIGFLACSISWIFVKDIHPALKAGKSLTPHTSGAKSANTLPLKPQI